jgi:hypothetical protein
MAIKVYPLLGIFPSQAERAPGQLQRLPFESLLKGMLSMGKGLLTGDTSAYLTDAWHEEILHLKGETVSDSWLFHCGVCLWLADFNTNSIHTSLFQGKKYSGVFFSARFPL